MVMDLLKEITQNNFLLLLMKDAEYSLNVEEIVKTTKKTKTKICYICLSRPLTDVTNDLNKSGIDADSIFFIDTLTSHYSKPESMKNCIFLSSPANLNDMTSAITMSIKDHRCNALLFDTISTLLNYQQTHSIIRFTNTLVTNTKEDIKKLFILLKGNEILHGDQLVLASDLEMFADKKIDFSVE